MIRAVAKTSPDALIGWPQALARGLPRLGRPLRETRARHPVVTFLSYYHTSYPPFSTLSLIRISPKPTPILICFNSSFPFPSHGLLQVHLRLAAWNAS